MTKRYKAHNLLPDPKPTGLRGWKPFGDVETRMAADGTGIYVRNISGGGGGRGVDCALPDLPAGDYVYAFIVSSSTYAKGEMVALIKAGGAYISTVRATTSNGMRAYTGKVTLTQTGCNLLFTPPSVAGGAMSFKRLLVVTREDWERMVTHNVDYFDGDSYTTGGGLPL